MQLKPQFADDAEVLNSLAERCGGRPLCRGRGGSGQGTRDRTGRPTHGVKQCAEGAFGAVPRRPAGARSSRSTAPMTWLRTRPNLHSDWAYFAGICLFAVLLRLPLQPSHSSATTGATPTLSSAWIQGDIPYHDSLEQSPGCISPTRWSSASSARVPRQFIGECNSTRSAPLPLYSCWAGGCPAAGGLAAAAFAAFDDDRPKCPRQCRHSRRVHDPAATAAMLASCCAVERTSLSWAFLTGVLAGLALIFQQVALSNVVFGPVRHLDVAAPTARGPDPAARTADGPRTCGRLLRPARGLGSIFEGLHRPQLGVRERDSRGAACGRVDGALGRLALLLARSCSSPLFRW